MTLLDALLGRLIPQSLLHSTRRWPAPDLDLVEECRAFRDEEDERIRRTGRI